MWIRPVWDDPTRVDHQKTFEIMALDMDKIGRVVKCRNPPIQILHPAMDRRVPGPDHLLVRLEQRDIDRIEADYRYIEPNVGLGNRLAVIEWSIVTLGREM